jgi:hypothetical protein
MLERKDNETFHFETKKNVTDEAAVISEGRNATLTQKLYWE